MKGEKTNCVALSPDEIDAKPENNKFNENIPSLDISEIIKNNFQKSVADMLPEIMKTVNSEMESIKAELKNELKTTTSEIVDEKIDKLKSQLELKVDIEQEKVKLKTLSECVLVKTYNRRYNIKIQGLEHNLAHGQRETYQETAKIVQKVAQEMNVRVAKNDIPIAQRLPANNGTPKPVIARFTRRVTKIELLTKKKKLHENSLLGNVKIYEDATKARLTFMKLLRNDERINKARRQYFLSGKIMRA